VEDNAENDPGRDVERDQHGPSPPHEGQRFVLLLLYDVESVLEFAQLMVNQSVLGETILGQPRTVQPVSVKGPLKQAGLNDSDKEP
jgi:hypothetical protein